MNAERVAELRLRAQATRERTLKLLADLEAAARSSGVPAPPDSFQLHLRRLNAREYVVAVMGEVNRGKSTFINALLGETILPTYVGTATNHVFRVRRAVHAAYRLRFEDGSAREINREDLARYGSESHARLEGPPKLDQVVRWIEVEGPFPFLPEEVTILDTPGLGTTFAAHDLITHRFLPHADGVVFLGDSAVPFVEPDLRYLGKVLEHTRCVFLVQTKIDQYKPAEWKAQLRRNEEILHRHFGDRIPQLRVWPIASTLLLKAAALAREGDPMGAEYEVRSLHRELMAALSAFLERGVGWSRVHAALGDASQYRQKCRALLEGRIEALKEARAQQQASLERSLKERERAYLADWGPQGRRRRELLEEVRRITELGRASAQQQFTRGGRIAQAQQQRIAAAGSVNEAKALAQELATEVGAQAAREWHQLTSEAEYRCRALLQPLQEESWALAVPVRDVEVDRLPLAAPSMEPEGFWQRTVREKGPQLALGAVAAFVLHAPLAIIYGIGNLISEHFFGGQGRRLQEAQQKLQRGLAEVMLQVEQAFFAVDFCGNRHNPVEEYFRGLERSVQENLDRIAERAGQEVRDELAALKRAAELDEAGRQAEAAHLRGMIEAWDRLGAELQQIRQELQLLERDLATALADPE